LQQKEFFPGGPSDKEAGSQNSTEDLNQWIQKRLQHSQVWLLEINQQYLKSLMTNCFVKKHFRPYSKLCCLKMVLVCSAQQH
uniref:Uncharacterized protein n=1 Tax=Echeneis naucrates TaxID=173247 RepID=A0A665V1X1_ECHNA